MSDEIQRTPEQLARLEARKVRAEQIAKLDADIAAAQAVLDGHNIDMLRSREAALQACTILDVLKAQKAALVSPLATAPESAVLDTLEISAE
jgi:hypothetical protein